MSQKKRMLLCGRGMTGKYLNHWHNYIILIYVFKYTTEIHVHWVKHFDPFEMKYVLKYIKMGGCRCILVGCIRGLIFFYLKLLGFGSSVQK